MGKASFEYDINSRDKTTKGTKSAKKNITSVGKTAEKTSKLMKAAFAGVSFAVVIKGIKEVSKAFEEQELVERRLVAAAKNNPLLDDSAVSGLNRYAAALQSASTFGNEAIIQQQAFLASMSLSERQIKDTMKAAVDLASTGMVSLESAVKNLSKTYGGMTGELGELIPSLKDLTAEELKAGAGIEFVATQYEGMAESVANTSRGMKTQIKNTFGDMAETIGLIFDGIGGEMIASIQPHIEALEAWLSTNSDVIVAFFKNLPKIAWNSLVFVKDAFFSLFNWEFIKGIGGAIWEYFKASAMSTIKTIWTYLKAVGTTIWTPLRYGFDVVVHAMKTAFFTVKDAIVGAFNAIINGINVAIDFAEEKLNKLIKLQNKVTPGSRFDIPELNLGEVGLIGTGRGGPGPKPVNDVGETILSAWKDVGTELVDNVKRQWKAFKGLGSDVADAFSNNPKFNAAFENFTLSFRALVPPIKKIVKNTEDTATWVSDGGAIIADAINRIDSSRSDAQLDPGPQGTKTGSMTKAIMEKIFKNVAAGLTNFASAIWKSIQGVEAVMMLMDPLATVVTRVATVLGPVLNRVLTPLVGILGVIGNVVGAILAPALEALAPVITLIGEVFVWLHNKIFKPIGNALIITFNILTNVIVGLANVFRAVANEFRTKANQKAMFKQKDLKAGLIEDISYGGDIVPTGTSMITDSGGTFGGGGASYTAGRTINQTVIINTDVIAGGEGIRGLAILIRDEIKSAERLGA